MLSMEKNLPFECFSSSKFFKSETDDQVQLVKWPFVSSSDAHFRALFSILLLC